MSVLFDEDLDALKEVRVLAIVDNISSIYTIGLFI